MAIINYYKKEINVKIVYCGPGLSGKTTNLQWLNQNLGEGKVGKLISLATKTDRTLFFDLLAVSLGKVQGFDTRIQLFTTPGQVYYNSTRKLVLKGVDGIVFVADSQEPMRLANQESLENLKENLKEYGRGLDEIPIVFQYNKRDLGDLLSLEDLQKDLNPRGCPFVEASAFAGKGVEETFRLITKATFQNMKDLHSGPAKPEPSPPTIPIQPPPVSPASKGLVIRRCLPAVVADPQRVIIPLVVAKPDTKEEFQIEIEVRLPS